MTDKLIGEITKTWWEKLQTNAGKVADGFPLMYEEWGEQTEKVKDALSRKDYRDALHHAAGYREAAQQHLSKLWFYTFWPKWGLVVYLILK